MSKVDAQRAMREAKYARNQASGPTRREAAAAAAGPSPTPAVGAAGTKPTRAASAAPTAAAPAATASATTAPATPAQGERCGHKSMNGRACTREPGHPEKSHRYS